MRSFLDKWLVILCGPYARWREMRQREIERQHQERIRDEIRHQLRAVRDAIAPHAIGL